MEVLGKEYLEKVREWIRLETVRCLYCGFCEPVCPTLDFGPHRGYGPRGRVNIAYMIVSEDLVTGEGVESIYTCLVCGACNEKCPAGIDIAGVVRAVRTLLNNRS
ncbi:MAG: (Fe-S)-binding protein [Desulfurococcales archaeon]|nr:(Fe-S)-binding protein [Desulfurococcales archaeon]